MGKHLLPILSFILPQFALACGLSELNISLVEISVLAILSSFALLCFFLFLKNDFNESSWQKVILSVSKNGLKVILVVSIYYNIMLLPLFDTLCLKTPQEIYFEETLPPLILAISVVFFFLQRKWPTNIRRHTLLLFLFFGTIVILYAYGFTIPGTIPPPLLPPLP